MVVAVRPDLRLAGHDLCFELQHLLLATLDVVVSKHPELALSDPCHYLRLPHEELLDPDSSGAADLSSSQLASGCTGHLASIQMRAPKVWACGKT